MWRAVVIMLFAVGPARADELETFLDEYEPHWTRMIAHLWKNVKVEGTAAYCDIVKKPGKPIEAVTFSAVADDKVMVRRATRTPLDGGPVAHTLTVVTPDLAVQYERTGDQPGWRQKDLAVPWRSARAALQYYSLMAGDQSEFGVYGPYNGRGPNAYWRASGLMPSARYTVSRGQYGGVAVTEVRRGLTLGTKENNWIIRLHPDDGRVIAAEEQGMVRLGVPPPGLVPTRHLMDVTYAPAPADIPPFPAAIRSRFVEPDGAETPGLSATFTEYRRYTPTADELDVGKLFGVTLPDPGPRPPLPPRGTYLPDPTPPPTLPPPNKPSRPAAPPDRDDRLLRVGLLGFIIVASLVAAVRLRR